jgi:KDO2-lipid IV(A) lauroyltransferase
MTALRDRIEYLGYRILVLAVRVLPIGLMYAVGDFVGRAVYQLGGKHVRWGLENARIAFPELGEAELRSIVAGSYAAFGRNAIDFIRAESWSDEEFEKHVSITGVEYIEQAHERGKGAFYVGAHLGNFELGVRAFAMLGTPTLAIGRPMRNRLLYARLERSRTRNGRVRLVDRKQSALQMLRAIKSNNGVGILLDQYVRKSRGVFVPLFGVRCSTSPAVAAIALRTGAALLCVSVARDGWDHHVVRFSPIEVPEIGEGENAVEVVTAACNRAIEERIRAHPDQWLWGHRRYRYSPDLEREPYVS